MRALPQPSRHLLLLSDGFPQDLDYGDDYLREMCSPNAYMVVDDVSDLPEELPEIYQRLVRAV